MKINITIVAFITFLLTACGTEDKFPQEVIDTTVNACIQQGGNKEQCECYAEKLQEKYTFEEFKDLEKKLMAGTPTPEFQAWADGVLPECMGQ